MPQLRLSAFLFGIVSLLGAFAAMAQDLVLPLQEKEWRFSEGKEFPGAQGSLGFPAEADGVATLTLQANFQGGGSYVAGIYALRAPVAVQQMRFSARSSSGVIALRVTDSGGQTFQQYLKVSRQAWRELEIREFGNPARKDIHYWGGANDGVVRQPLTAIAFVCSKDAASVDGTASVRDVVLKPVRQALKLTAVESLGQPGKPSVFVFASARPVETADLEYEIRSCGGQGVIRRGRASFDSATKRIQLTQELPRGFYEIQFAENADRFGLMVLEPYAGKPDPFFAIDGAFTVFGTLNPVERQKQYLSWLRSGGVTTMRDRFIWKTAEEKQGAFDASMGALGGEAKRALCREYGLRVLDVFHDAPVWTGSMDNRKSEAYSPYPKDLPGTYKSWLTIAPKYEGVWAGLEVWNEPDILFGAYLPGDHQAALTKAISRAFQEAGSKTPVVGCVFTDMVASDPETAATFFRNGILDDADAFSFHNYRPAIYCEQIIADFREELKGSGREAIPFWITESGKPWKRGPARAPAEEDRVSAAEICMKAVESRACGVRAYYPFVFPFYNENQHNFGMVDENHSPMLSLAAYLQCVSRLSETTYVGDLACEGAEICRVFATPAREAIIVAYTGDTPSAKVVVPANIACQAEGIDGRALTVKQGKVEVADGMIYLRTTLSEVQPVLKTDTRAMALNRLAASWQAPARKALPVVLQPVTEVGAHAYCSRGYFYGPEREFTRSYRINNLSGQELKVALRAQADQDVEVALEGGGAMTIPPYAAKEVVCRVRVPEAVRRFSLTLMEATGQATALQQTYLERRPERVQAAHVESFEGAASAPEEMWTAITHSGSLNGGANQKNAAGGNTARFRCEWSGNQLRIVLEVQDPVFCQPYVKDEMWMGDSVQIGLHSGSGSLMRITEITGGMTREGPQLYLHSSQANTSKATLLSASALTVTCGRARVQYRMDLDAKELGLPAFSAEQVLGMSLVVNNNDGKGRTGYLSWGEGIARNKNAIEFNEIQLEK